MPNYMPIRQVFGRVSLQFFDLENARKYFAVADVILSEVPSV